MILARGAHQFSHLRGVTFTRPWWWWSGCRWWLGGLLEAGLVVAQAVGVAVEGEDDGAMQPVEHGGGDGAVAEDLAPGPRRGLS